jgi:hypothetical protein
LNQEFPLLNQEFTLLGKEKSKFILITIKDRMNLYIVNSISGSIPKRKESIVILEKIYPCLPNGKVEGRHGNIKLNVSWIKNGYIKYRLIFKGRKTKGIYVRYNTYWKNKTPNLLSKNVFQRIIILSDKWIDLM